MIHHVPLRPPSRDFPADEWIVIEKGFHPEFLAQLETMLALGNGYLGMRGCPEEGGPNTENATLINGFYETRPIVYGEEAYGFAKTGQTILNVTDSKIIKLFVDDEPFWLPNANLLRYDRRLNMKSGTLDRLQTCMGLFLSSGCFRFADSFLFGAGKAVFRPVTCDQVRGARGRGQGTETVAKRRW